MGPLHNDCRSARLVDAAADKNGGALTVSSLNRLVTSSLLALALSLLAAAVAFGHDGRVHDPLPDSGRGGTVGKLVLDHGDDFAAGRKTERYHLETGRESVRLSVAAEVAAEPGATVRVHGRRVGNLLAVDETADGTAAIETIAAAAGSAEVDKRVLVLLINFSNDTSQPYSTGTAHSIFFNNVAQYYMEASYGNWTTTGEVRGWWTIPDTNANCDYSNWGSLARQRATSEGINLSSFTNIVYAFPSAGCGWSGLAQVNGPWSWLQGTGGMSTRVAAHELGHNYGAHHASTITCTAGGVRVPYSSSCTQSEYGDPFDVMGTGTKLNWAWHRKQMTLMPATDMQTVSGSGTYTVQPVALNGSSPKTLRIVRPDGYYWYVEYRVPFGTYDNFTAGAQPTNGVLIRLAPNTSRVQSRLVDANPGTTTFTDAAFAPGQTFIDGLNNIRIRVDSISPTGATVTFNPTTGDSQPPTAPGSFTATAASSSSINLTWTASTDNVGVTGYEIRRDGNLIATPGASATSFLDTGRTAGITYTYAIAARDAAGNTSPTATTTGFIQPPTQDTTPPSAPTSLTGSNSPGFKVSLSWGASTDNVGVTGYRIYANGVQVATSTGTSINFKSSKGTKTFTVRAVDAAGNVSAASNGVTLNL